jgi:hypothetical protein
MRYHLLASFSLFLLGCSADRHCDLIKRQDFPAPDGKHIAVVFEMCCYDTTGYYPHVSVLRLGQRLGDTGNLLSGGPGDFFTVSWKGPDSLLLEYRPDGNFAFPPPANTNIDGVAVTLRRLPK